jgi:3-oxoacyl-[acyl-carrier-protein] synthase-3
MSCPVFDLKNACNSFLNGLDVADSYIKSWKYKKILVCSGETPSKVIQYFISNREEFKKYFAGYTFWDAWAAMLLTASEEKKWILSSFLYSDGSCWDLGTIMW